MDKSIKITTIKKLCAPHVLLLLCCCSYRVVCTVSALGHTIWWGHWINLSRSPGISSHLKVIRRCYPDASQ
ncbi:hypothetical protein BDV24DRAFT_129981 [Aspergillus arachidicola]|uniref:Uncharacterized protein n=1 Tax=Aspergillus arachidicola TaxID=656916 RepID=A0A5N6YBQ5_9EURO|nr:hypothetical protein BDV24DRAFT_129981 [Aspergillus arachidicola]